MIDLPYLERRMPPSWKIFRRKPFFLFPLSRLRVFFVFSFVRRGNVKSFLPEKMEQRSKGFFFFLFFFLSYYKLSSTWEFILSRLSVRSAIENAVNHTRLLFWQFNTPKNSIWRSVRRSIKLLIGLLFLFTFSGFQSQGNAVWSVSFQKKILFTKFLTLKIRWNSNIPGSIGSKLTTIFLYQWKWKFGVASTQ